MRILSVEELMQHINGQVLENYVKANEEEEILNDFINKNGSSEDEQIIIKVLSAKNKLSNLNQKLESIRKEHENLKQEAHNVWNALNAKNNVSEKYNSINQVLEALSNLKGVSVDGLAQFKEKLTMINRELFAKINTADSYIKAYEL